MDPEMLPESVRAARFIYLNQYCFNGLYRLNNRGEFNVPYGNRKGHLYTDYGTILLASQVLRKAMIRCEDFEVILDECREGDFVYIDPPYTTSKKRMFSEYNGQPFSQNDLKRLKKILEHLDSVRVAFVLSYLKTDKTETFFSHWIVGSQVVRRNIAGFSQSRKTEIELIISNIKNRSII